MKINCRSIFGVLLFLAMLCVGFSNIAKSQTVIRFSGMIKDPDRGRTLRDVRYTLTKEGKFIEEQTLKKGRFSFYFEVGKTYTLQFFMGNFSSERIEFNTRIPEDYDYFDELPYKIVVYPEPGTDGDIVNNYIRFDEKEGYFVINGDGATEMEKIGYQVKSSIYNKILMDSIMQMVEVIKNEAMAESEKITKASRTEKKIIIMEGQSSTTRKKQTLQNEIPQPPDLPDINMDDITMDIQILLDDSSRFLSRKEMIQEAREQIDDIKIMAVCVEDSLMIQCRELEILHAENEILQTESQLKEARKQIELQQERLAAQRNIIFISIGAGLILLFLIIITLRQYFVKKKANILLGHKNARIKQQNEEIVSQRDEIASQRDMVLKQKEQIELIHSEVTDSIFYARRIQKAIFPTSEHAAEIFSDHFILFRPKDVVSGDFYWFTRKADTVFVTVADCTGHGVPGAFMSMLGISFLNEIISNKEVSDTAVILNSFRKFIIESLHQKGVSGEQKDGLDMALCKIEKSEIEPGLLNLSFSGAGNSLYIISKINTANVGLIGEGKHKDQGSGHQIRRFVPTDYELIEIRGDKMPIAIYDIMSDFTATHASVSAESKFYMLSDGYADQFGGPQGKKFKYKPIKEILLKHSGENLPTQKNKLEAVLDEWMSCLCPETNKSYPQIDDITVLGFKL